MPDSLQEDEFNPNEPRNKVGEWTTGGAGKSAGKSIAAKPTSGTHSIANQKGMQQLNQLAQRFQEHVGELGGRPTKFSVSAINLVKQVQDLQEAAKHGNDIAIELRRLSPITETSTALVDLANLYLNLAKATYIKGYARPGDSSWSLLAHKGNFFKTNFLPKILPIEISKS